MGSQTLEILRQGFWASLTGGWFFDPHQDLFCNTFHMYLWLCLLFTPFVLHMTTTSSLLPSIIYPISIFILFAILKYASHKLHLLFDGEELLEDKVSKKESKEEISNQQKDAEAQNGAEATPKETQLDTALAQLMEHGDIQANADLMEHIEKFSEDFYNLHKEELMKSNFFDHFSSADLINKSNTDLVTPKTPHSYSPEKACIVDLHHTKMLYRVDENTDGAAAAAEMLEKQEEKPSTSIVSSPVLPIVNSEEEDLIIANEPTVSDYKADNEAEISLNVSEPFPLHFESQSADDSSSWGSSVCSSESDIQEVKVKFMPIDNHGHQQGMISDNGMGTEVKSEGTLTTMKKDFENNSNTEDDKTVSMSALETKEDPTNFGGARPKTSHSVGFSLPEIESVPTTSYLNSNGQSKSEEESSPSILLSDGSIIQIEEDFLRDRASALSSHPRTIQRIGAFRDTTARNESRAYLRFRNRANSESPGTSLLQPESESGDAAAAAEAKHIAMSYEDTTDGAVHCFQDELGQWFSYAFGDAGAQPLPSSFKSDNLPNVFSTGAMPKRRDSLSSSISQADLDRALPGEADFIPSPRRWEMAANAFLRQNFPGPSARVEEPVPKKYYMLPIVRNFSMKISFDRLALLALLDRNKNSKQAVISVLLATLVAVLGYLLLTRDYFYDFWLFLMCFVIAKCQFALIKSVQPDSASPVHGHNYTIVFSRAVYFCIIAVTIICVDEAALQKPESITLYGVTLYAEATLVFARDLLIAFILGFPILFVLGLLPQINTFTMHILEQFDMHIFGGSGLQGVSFVRNHQIYMWRSTGKACYLLKTLTSKFSGRNNGRLSPWRKDISECNILKCLSFKVITDRYFDLCIVDIDLFLAMTSLLAAVYAILRSIFSVLLLVGFCYFPLKHTEEGKEKGQHVMFSVFTGLVAALSYHLGRSTSSPEIMLKAVGQYFCCVKKPDAKSDDEEIDDPLPEKLISTMKTRLVHDLIVCVVIAFVVFAVHVSTVFTSLQEKGTLQDVDVKNQPVLSYVLYALTGSIGVLIHYVLPQLRKQLPWLLVASPVLKSYEYQLYECQEHSRVMWFEKLYVWLCLLEKNILYPLICMSTMTYHADMIAEKFGPIVGAFIITTTSVKMLRSSFMNTPRQHIIMIWTVLFFEYDYRGYTESYLIDYFFMSIFVEKMLELYMKFKFILTYTAPWQITWGSAFHAFAQPVSVPHCGMLFFQAIVSAFASAPLNPFLGSAIFITSYMRPIKFWEKDYNTKRVDHSNTRLSTHIESNPGADDNNLNSIFYEHLTRSLQHSLCGDLLLGRWGNFSSGDCFIMASDYLNALVHIIEVGNGYVTFQLRGLEFRGCCCFNPGHLKNMLSLNTTFSQRWLAWEVVQSKYILEGYSVSDNTATTMFQMFDLRKIFITYYVTSIIFYCCRNKKLKTWLADDTLMDQLNELTDSSFVDLDTIFRAVTDKDYDLTAGGITRGSFCQNYHDWITCCNKQRKTEERVEDDSVDSKLVTLCFALSLLGRRLLSTASNNQWNAALKSFLHGLHTLFKGDFRVTATKDEWVFSDPDLALLRLVVAPAVRMALKLHQDHFTCVDEFDDNTVLFETISQHEEQFVICHEGHPAWRQAVLHNKPNLLALRYVLDDGTDDYKIIMLIKRCLNFRVIKVNKECVRGLWAGQLQELIFLRNRNPERGSIQNAKQALRNMINSSCDQPIGYPIYVSPLTTSYAETNPFYNRISMSSLNLTSVRQFFRRCYGSVVNQYAGHCSGTSHGHEVEIEMSYIPPQDSSHHLQVTGNKPSTSRSSSKISAPSSKGLGSLRTGSYSSIPASSNSSSASTSASQGDTHSSHFPYYPSEGKARLKDIAYVTDALNSSIHTELDWSNIPSLKEHVNMISWDGWYPQENLIGDILYHWEPDSEEQTRKSHVGKKIYLLSIESYIVPALEDGVELLSDNSKQQELEV